MKREAPPDMGSVITLTPENWHIIGGKPPSPPKDPPKKSGDGGGEDGRSLRLRDFKNAGICFGISLCAVTAASVANAGSLETMSLCTTGLLATGMAAREDILLSSRDQLHKMPRQAYHIAKAFVTSSAATAVLISLSVASFSGNPTNAINVDEEPTLYKYLVGPELRFKESLRTPTPK